MTSLDASGGRRAWRHALRHRRRARATCAISPCAPPALVRAVDVVAFFAKRGHARQCAPHRGAADGTTAGPRCGCEYPVTDEIPAEHPDYQRQIGGFYRESAESLAALLRDGKSVGLLAEGDPFFYGSFMHMWRRLATDFPVEVVPGVTGMSGCWTRANLPMTWGNDMLAVLPGTLGRGPAGRAPAAHRCRGDHEGRPQPREGAPRRRDARACCRARSMSSAAPCRTSASCRSPTAASAGAYFAMVLIPGEGRRL